MRLLARVFVIAAVLSFSLPSIVFSTDRFEKGPADVWLIKNDALNDGWMPSIPRGALVECYVEISAQDFKSKRFEGAKVQIVGDNSLRVLSNVKIIDKLPPRTDPDRYGIVSNYNRGKAPALKFFLYVSVKAELGPRTLHIKVKEGAPLVLENTLRVCNPLVVIIDIDGMTRKEFYTALAYPSYECPNLRRLMGAPIEAGGYVNPNTGLSWFEYQNGIAVNEAVTVFPTVTFAGHAAIVSGADPNQFKMAGNEWFDRKKDYKFAYVGDNLGVLGAGDSFESFNHEFANRRLLDSGVTTVFQEAYENAEINATSYVNHLMYYGDPVNKAAYLQYMSIPDQVQFATTTYSTDHSVALEASIFIQRREKDQKLPPLPNPLPAPILHRAEPKPIFTKEEYDHLGIVLLYFAGLDHFCHGEKIPGRVEGRDGKQAIYLKEHIDPALGLFLKSLSDVTYKNTTFLFIADHGHTTMRTKKGDPGDAYACFSVPRTVPKLNKFQDLLWEAGYHPYGAGLPVPVTGPLFSSAVVGLNGGMVHVYLRRLKRGQSLQWSVNDPGGYGENIYDEAKLFSIYWKTPPDYGQVERVASWFHHELMQQSEVGANRSLAMILVRDAGLNSEEEWFSTDELADAFKANYRVYLGPSSEQASGARTVSLEEYFKSKNGKEFLKNNGWHDERDTLLVIDRIRRLQGQMSGDLILMPNYPYFYAEYKPLYGDHGSLSRSDFEIPFVLARPGASTNHDLPFMRKVLEDEIELDTIVDWEKGAKNRPSNTDVKKVVLKLLQPPERRFIEVREGKKIIRGKNINNTYK